MVGLTELKPYMYLCPPDLQKALLSVGNAAVGSDSRVDRAKVIHISLPTRLTESTTMMSSDQSRRTSQFPMPLRFSPYKVSATLLMRLRDYADFQHSADAAASGVTWSSMLGLLVCKCGRIYSSMTTLWNNNWRFNECINCLQNRSILSACHRLILSSLTGRISWKGGNIKPHWR